MECCASVTKAEEVAADVDLSGIAMKETRLQPAATEAQQELRAPRDHAGLLQESVHGDWVHLVGTQEGFDRLGYGRH